MDRQTDLFTDTTNTEYQVKSINKKDTHWLLLNVHYAKRLPPMSYAYGLFRSGDLLGVVTYGMPASPSLCKGVCGPEHKHNVLELNRLCLVNNDKGEASRLVGGSLRLLPRPKIIVSYADTSQGHAGTVYQATNFIYTGSTIPRNEIAVRGLEHMHSKALSNTGTLAELRERHGVENVYQRPRAVKHRYVYFVGSKTETKNMRRALRYEIKPYPKA